MKDTLNVRDGPLENFFGGRGGEVQKKYSHKGKLNEKKYSCYGLKKIHTRNLITKKKKFLRLENSPPPPHDFSNGPSLIVKY